MRKIFKIGLFFVFSPMVLLISLTLLSLSYQSNQTQTFSTYDTKGVAYAALPPSSAMLDHDIIQQDARLTVVKDFFEKYKSDLLPFAQDVIDSADKYGLDYRLIPAIAMQESNLCKKAPKDSYNCWGFGIYGKKVTRFDNYKDAIDTVTKTLANQYKANGLETPEEIMSRYTPSSNGSWAFGVNHFMDQLNFNL